MNTGLKSWSDRLRQAERELEANPVDIQICDSFWELLDGGVGNNLKGLERAIRTYRPAALSSEIGIARLTDALFEVFETSGRLPIRADLGPELYKRIFDLTVEPELGHLGWLRKSLLTQPG
ncbi:MAG: hypothetical protein WDO72_13445 [Pseudomonadota bacterium]